VINALRRSRVYGYRSIVFALIICVLYAISDEVHQLFDQWSKARKFAVVRELKPEEDRKQLSLLESSDYTPAM